MTDRNFVFTERKFEGRKPRKVKFPVPSL